MKTTFYVTLDEREDGTKVWVAKCNRCDAVLVGEQARDIPVVQATRPLPPNMVAETNRRLHTAWTEARKHGTPILIPSPDLELITVPDHGLQRALDAHVDSCSAREAKP